jgi:YVTN family beta-propeller protein
VTNTYRAILSLLTAMVVATGSWAQSFVNWESPHVTPLDLTPNGKLLLAINTADNRLEVFGLTKAGLDPLGAVTVGLDPVSVRALSNSQAWVVNHVSDTISIVDLQALNVVATLYPGDEPADVVFAGKPLRAFVTVSQLNQVKVYDPANLAAAPVTIQIEGEDPRALATDGTTVYAAIFESGNRTTSLSEFAVSTPRMNPYRGAPNPPPNSGARFNPPIEPGLPEPPNTGIIVRKDDQGAWLDDNSGDWSLAVGWDLHDHDIAIIEADTLATSYATGIMNLNMALGIKPGAGLTVVGTEALNEVRFESNINGVFLRVMGALVGGPGVPQMLHDLNPQLDYSVPTVPQSIRNQALGDPRGVAWTSAGDRGYITGMGSNNLVALDGAWNRTALIETGQGPTGVRIDEKRGRVYVLNKFDATISIIDADSLMDIDQVAFYDPTPPEITLGRPFLYDTHRTSGLGHLSCASCHIDARMDQLAWDLGNPQGQLEELFVTCLNLTAGANCQDWHPMKGPMVTQPLIGISSSSFLHWRADQALLADFNPTFENLQGADVQLTDAEMEAFDAFIATLAYPPNPYRRIDGSLRSSFPNGGNPSNGRALFTGTSTHSLFRCQDCHDGPGGGGGSLVQANLLDLSQSFLSPQLRNLYEKTGRDDTSLDNNRGFGFLHDGTVDRLTTFFEFFESRFDVTPQEVLDLEAYLMSFSTDTHAGVGVQATLPSRGGEPATVNQLIAIASDGAVELVARGVISGEPRGYYLLDAARFQSDRAAQRIDASALQALAAEGAEITFTLVPQGSAARIGVDRDQDGVFDGDEVDLGTDPADPDDLPAPILGDVNGDWVVNTTDLLALLGLWGPCSAPCAGDLNGDEQVSVADMLILFANWN